jgi:tetratricopeptide (TPR) repeat protein
VELLKAGALTFAILSLGSVLTMVADWSDHHATRIAIGSFHAALSALRHTAVPAVFLSLLGGIQLLLEFATAARAATLAFRVQAAGSGDIERETKARRERFGRLAFCTSVAFLVLMVRLPAWTAYLELLNQSRVIREFILRDDLHRIYANRPMQAPSPLSQPLRDLELAARRASMAWNSERYAAALDDYKQIAAMLESVPRSSLTGASLYLAAQSLNGGAWLMATCPEATLRNPVDAVKYARRAVDLWPNDGAIWNTLGVAYYRLGEWEEARSALYRSMELRYGGEGDAFDWFFLAIIHAKLGYPERAQSWYDKAAEWSRQDNPGNFQLSPMQVAELSRFQVEAAQVLGLPKPEPIPIRPSEKNARPLSPMIYPRGNIRRARNHIIDPSMPAN